MSKNKHTVHLFSHLPKTGGTTIKNELLAHHKLGENFFHFAINGFKIMSHIGKSPFDTLAHFQKSEGDKIILFGHKVNEGLLHNHLDSEIILSTMLRHPFSRCVSQYYMKKNGDPNFSVSMENFLAKFNNSMCQFFVKRFPSLTLDPFTNISQQAFNVLCHFDNVFFLEDAPDSFDKMLDVYGLSYNPIYNANIASNKGYKKIVLIEDLNQTFFENLRPDLELYYRLKNREEGKKSKDLPTNFQLPNYWLVFFVKKLLAQKEFAQPYFNSLQSAPLRKLLKPQLQFDSIDYKVLLLSLIEVESEGNLTTELKDNFFDLFNYILFKINTLPSIPSELVNTFYGSIVHNLNIKSSKSLEDLDEQLINALPNNHLSSLIAKSKVSQLKKDFESATSLLMDAVRTYPTEVKTFEKLFYLSKKTNNKELSQKCFNKVIELSQTNKITTQVLSFQSTS